MIKVITLALLISGCTAIDAYKSVAIGLGSKVATQALIDAEYVICKAAPVGAVEARYNTINLINARREICNRHIIKEVIHDN